MLDFVKNISPPEIAIIALILVVFLGGKVVTRLARTGGETLREVKKVKKTFNEVIENEAKKA